MNWRLYLPAWLRRVVRGTATYGWKRVDDVPEPVTPATVYLVGDGPEPWSAVMVCPCGCEATLSLSLIPADSPSWRASVSSAGQLTLHPSVWRKRGCRSHFSVVKGQVIWSRTRARAPD